MKFSQIAKGASAERPVKVLTKGKEIPARLRPLSAMEEADAVASAIAFSRKKNSEPKAGQPIYESALAAATVAAATLDDDSPPEKREPFFDGGMDSALDLDTDAIAILFEEQQAFQEETSPSFRAKSTHELFALLKEVVEKDDPFFYRRISPATRWSLQRITGALLRSARVLKLWDTSPASPDGETTSPTGSVAGATDTTKMAPISAPPSNAPATAST